MRRSLKGKPRGTRTPPMVRFFDKVIPCDVTGCWLWTGSKVGNPKKSRSDYPSFGAEKVMRAHRWIYQQMVGPITSETLDHLCDNRYCVNPAHLRPATFRENILRGNNMAARHSRKTHCKQGHELTTENMYERQKWRRCKTCSREMNRASYHRGQDRQRATLAV